MANTAQGNGWIAVDLDGTLAFHETGYGSEEIGAPVPAMLARVKRWLDDGYDVRIFTARADCGRMALRAVERRIKQWCLEHIGQELPVTCKKNFDMIEMWDDRCVQVIPNTGRTLTDEFEFEKCALLAKTAFESRKAPTAASNGTNAAAAIQKAFDTNPQSSNFENAGVPVRGEQWQLRDLPPVSPGVFDKLVALAGANNIRWIQVISSPNGKRGQFLISTLGEANLKKAVLP